MGFLDGSMGRESICNAGDTWVVGSVPGSGRSPGEGNGNPFQYPYQEIPWTDKPGGLQSIVSQRVRHDWATQHLAGMSWWKKYIKVFILSFRKQFYHTWSSNSHSAEILWNLSTGSLKWTTSIVSQFSSASYFFDLSFLYLHSLSSFLSVALSVCFLFLNSRSLDL